MNSIEELKATVNKAQSSGKYFQPPKGVVVVAYSIDAKPQVRMAHFGSTSKEQMLVNIFGVDGTEFPDGPKEWWVSTNSPLAVDLLDGLDKNLKGTAKIMRSGDGKETRYELLE